MITAKVSNGLRKRRIPLKFEKGTWRGVPLRSSSNKIRCEKCSKIKIKKSNFYQSITNPSGYSSYCKSCKRKDSGEWRKENLGHIRQRNKDCKAKNPGLYRWYGVSYRAVKIGVELAPKAEFIGWFDSQKKECVYCGIGNDGAVILFGKSLTVDRKDNSGGYVPENLCMACIRCNVVKNAYLTHDQMMKVADMFFRPEISKVPS